MRESFIHLYQLNDNFQFEFLVRDLATGGLALRNSYSGLITALNDIGDQIETSIDQISAAIQSHQTVNLQFWLDSSTDVICCLKKLGTNRIVEEYYWAGFNEIDLTILLRTILKRFKLKAVVEEYLFLVIDLKGETVELDWDSLSNLSRFDSLMCPEILGILEDRKVDFLNCVAQSKPIQIGRYVILDRIGLLD